MTLPVTPAARQVRVGLPGGIELHCIEQGTGPALILLHGGMGDCGSWAAQIDALADPPRVIAYSRRHSSPNRNPGPAGANAIEEDIDDLLALQQRLDIGRADLVGTSYGGLLALCFALAHPDRVASLALAEPPLHRWACRTPAGAALFAAFMDGVWLPAGAAFAACNAATALRLLSDGIWGRPVFDSMPPARQAAALRNAAAMQALVQMRDPFPDLDRTAVAALTMPILLVRGEHASPLHRRVIDELARVAGAARLAVIAGAGHASPQENPLAFNAALRAHLLRGRDAAHR